MIYAHVFVVDADSYPVHRDRLFCGVKNPNRFSRRGSNTILNPSFFGLYADLKTLRVGDIVFFYQMRKQEEKHKRGFRGIFRIKSEPFFDTNDIEGVGSSLGELGSANKKVLGKCPFCNTSISDKKGDDGLLKCQKCNRTLNFHILPNRVLIEPIKLFRNRNTGEEAVIDDNTAYIDRNYIKKNLPILWTMLFRKVYGAGRERSITHILPEEANKLRFIFEDLFEETKLNTLVPYEKPPTAQPITIPLDCDSNGELKIEALLEAWMMENIDKNIPVLKDILGNPKEIEYFGNNVLYGIGGEKVDVLCIHNKNGERFKATVIELKRKTLTKKDVLQIKDYTKWTAQLVFGDSTKESKSKIQPVLIGFNTPQRIIDFARNLITETKSRIILNYKVEDNTIKFESVL
jgi:hypothetical protein